MKRTSGTASEPSPSLAAKRARRNFGRFAALLLACEVAHRRLEFDSVMEEWEDEDAKAAVEEEEEEEKEEEEGAEEEEEDDDENGDEGEQCKFEVEDEQQEEEEEGQKETVLQDRKAAYKFDLLGGYGTDTEDDEVVLTPSDISSVLGEASDRCDSPTGGRVTSPEERFAPSDAHSIRLDVTIEVQLPKLA